MYEKIRIGRLYEKIVERIEERILRGDLKPGDKLPSERELVEQFGVSRTAVREAMKALTQKGLIEVQPGRGTFVTDGTARAMRHSLGMVMKIGQDEGARNLLEVREILEPEMAALAAYRATDEQIIAMKESIAVMDAAMEDVETFIEADLDFHLALAEATQNVLIPALIDSLVDLLRELRERTAMAKGGLQRAQEHHKRILQAITERDPAAAREAMRAHMCQVHEDSGTQLDPSG